MNDTARYVLKPRPPVRAFLIAAVAAVLGAALLVLAAARGAGDLWVALPGLLLALGLALAVVAGLSMVRMRTFVELDDEGYRITGPGTATPGNNTSGRWSDVTRVTTSAGGAHLTLHHGDESRTHVLCPAGGEDAQMQALVAGVARHLDANRGYGPPINL